MRPEDRLVKDFVIAIANAVSEGYANTRARLLRTLLLVLGLVVLTSSVSAYYGSQSSTLDRKSQLARELGEFTWTVTSPGASIASSECIDVMSATWATAAVGLRAEKLVAVEATGKDAEFLKYYGSPDTLDPTLNGVSGTLVGPAVIAEFPSETLVMATDTDTWMAAPIEIDSRRFPEYSNAVLVPEPLEQIDVCIVDVVASLDLDFLDLLTGRFDAPQLVVSPVASSLVPQLRSELAVLNSGIVRLVTVLAGTMVLVLPSFLDRREKGLLRTLGWRRLDVIVISFSESMCVLLPAFSIALAVTITTSWLAFTPLGLRAGVHTILFVYGGFQAVVVVNAVYWSMRSPRSMLLAQ